MTHLFAAFESFLSPITPPIAVAVSGGADSFALLLLAQKWAEQKGGRVVALTVDHGLRHDSALEAQRVHESVLKRGIKHVILKWEGDKPTSHVQEKARTARYHLLLSWCRAHHISTLLLGHHAQDQEETFWLRLTSGSGLKGLGGMSQRWVKEGITLLRPLLGVKPEDLKEFLKAENQDWIEDPSNKNERFFRGRFRSFLKEEGLSSDRLLKTMEKLQEDADFIQEALKETLARLVELHPGGYVSFSQEDLDGLHPALAKRVVSSLMQWFSGGEYAPRSLQLEGVLKKLKARRPFTAGRIYWFFEKGKIYLSRELSAIERPLFLKDVSEKRPWDQRFWISPELKTFFPEDTCLGSLKSGFTDSSFSTILNIPRRIWPSLPTILVKEEVVAIPHLCYSRLRNETDLEKLIYLKPLFHDSLRFTI
jgi:tRNA(Ile)-lysidine synthase